MARGGFVKSILAVARLADAVGDGALAERALREALALGNLEAKGRRGIDELPTVAPVAESKMTLPDATTFDPGRFGEPEPIPRQFWLEASANERDRWDLRQGVVWAYELAEDGAVFADLTIKEKDLNALIELRRPTNVDDEPTDRMKHAEWVDWVAAIAMLAHEQRIHAHSSLTSLRDAVEEKLNAWGSQLPRKAQATVNPYLRQIVNRFRDYPPETPKGSGGEKP